MYIIIPGFRHVNKKKKEKSRNLKANLTNTSAKKTSTLSTKTTTTTTKATTTTRTTTTTTTKATKHVQSIHQVRERRLAPVSLKQTSLNVPRLHLSISLLLILLLLRQQQQQLTKRSPLPLPLRQLRLHIPLHLATPPPPPTPQPQREPTNHNHSQLINLWHHRRRHQSRRPQLLQIPKQRSQSSHRQPDPLLLRLDVRQPATTTATTLPAVPAAMPLPSGQR